MSTPSTSTRPRSGLSRPIRCFISTLLPEPERPMIASVSPSRISSETSTSTGRSSKLL